MRHTCKSNKRLTVDIRVPMNNSRSFFFALFFALFFVLANSMSSHKNVFVASFGKLYSSILLFCSQLSWPSTKTIFAVCAVCICYNCYLFVFVIESFTRAHRKRWSLLHRNKLRIVHILLWMYHYYRKYLESSCRFGVVAILLNDALGLIQITGFGFRFPPVDEIAVKIKLSSLVIETVCDFVANDKTDGTVIQITWPIGRKELSLKNASWKFCECKKKLVVNSFAPLQKKKKNQNAYYASHNLRMLFSMDE